MISWINILTFTYNSCVGNWDLELFKQYIAGKDTNVGRVHVEFLLH